MIRSVALFLLIASSLVAQDATMPRFEVLGDRVKVLFGDDLFTSYRFFGEPKPIFFPVLGPGAQEMTRRFPMGTRDGEAKDHPHHRSLWFAHGNVNGVDFWTEGKMNGRVFHEGFVDWPKDGSFAVANRWVGPDGKLMARDERRYRFGEERDAEGKVRLRWLDYEVTLRALDRDLVLGDTKEGTMAIRVAAELRQEGKVAAGSILDSEGRKDGACWGKRSRWVAYSGPVGESVVGLALFDHPSNHAHPTRWHARRYGLLGANPFGLHDFEKAPKGTGDLTIPAGGEQRFRYRFVFFGGAPMDAGVPKLYESWIEN